MKQYDKARLNSIPIEDVFRGEMSGHDLKKAGNLLVCKCPWHADSDPSFKIDPTKNTFKCYGSCEDKGSDVIALTMKATGMVFQDACEHLVKHYDSSAVSHVQGKKKGGAGRPASPIMPIPDDIEEDSLIKYVSNSWWKEKFGDFKKLWVYRDSSGKRLYYDVRFEKDHKKDVIPFYYSKKGWQSKLPHDLLKKDRVLYNLHLLWKESKKPVLVVEGCKCAEDTQFAGLHEKLILTTWPGGVNGIDFLDVTPLQDRKVFIWPDNDAFTGAFGKAGYRAAYDLRRRLSGNPDVTVLKASENPSKEATGKGYDIYDYVQDGGDPIEYIKNKKNYITDERVRVLAGIMPDAPVLSDFRSSGKFTWLKELDADVVRKVHQGLYKNKDDFSVKKTDLNFLHILNHDPNFKTLVAYDVATNEVKFSDKYTERGHLTNAIWEYCLNNYSIGPSTAQRDDMIKAIVRRNKFNSLELFLLDLRTEQFQDGPIKFDKNPLHKILEYISFHVEFEYDDPEEIYRYYYELFDKFFIRMFLKLECIITGNDRFPPADIVPILEGAQGIGKSRLCKFFSILEQEYYIDTSGLELKAGRDIIAAIRGKLIAELGELSALKKTQVEEVKSFISGTVDEQRRLYSEDTVKTPRTISIIGTTNENTYLRDMTGNRRFWPVRIRAISDQLYKNISLMKQLYVYYHDRARKAIEADKMNDELQVSGGLYKFAQYMREEARVKPLYLDRIIAWINNEELETYSEDPVVINLGAATEKILKPFESQTQKFDKEFIGQLKKRGYINKRAKFQNGPVLNVWELQGRWCPSCNTNVEGINKVLYGDKSRGACDACVIKDGEGTEKF